MQHPTRPRLRPSHRAAPAALFEACEERRLLTAAPPTGSISGAVFIDYSADGKFSDGDTAVPTVTIFIDANNNAKLDAKEAKTLTDADGHYSFTALKPGKYTLREVVPANHRQSSPDPATATTAAQKVSLTASPTAVGINFSIEPTAGAWTNFAGDAQHTAVSGVVSQDLNQIVWQTPVDQQPQVENDVLFVHYGPPIFTGNNVVIVPVKTGADDSFQLEGRRGSDGKLLWTVASDYIQPNHNATLGFSPCLAANNRVYFPTAGGTISYFDNADQDGVKTVHQLSFLGLARYTKLKANFDAHVFVDTPLTADDAGNVYFGVQSDGLATGNQLGGIVRFSAKGAGKFITAAKAAKDVTIDKIAHNSAPALSNDGKTLYVAVNHTSGIGHSLNAPDYLLALNSTSLAPIARAALIDPVNHGFSRLNDAASSSPTVGPDGDVYIGAQAAASENHGRGFLLHFDKTLKQIRTPGAFGWDNTASIIPKSMVPSYQGTSSYLIMTKYNNYDSLGGDGINKLAILDPNASQIDPISGGTTMLEVLTIAGATPEPDPSPDAPNAVYEWCINTAAVDPATGCVLANSEDGKLYRWNLASNTLTQVITLTGGIGESYTPTVIGPDGAVYAINTGILFHVGA